MNFKNYINKVPNFPHKGIVFRDIQPLLENNEVFNNAIKFMGNLVETPDLWVAVESRGFIFASALAAKFGGGISLIRKKGKLPPDNLVSISYDLEYGSGILEMKKSTLIKKAVIVDDVLATGGTLKAAEFLCKKSNLIIQDKLVLIDICISDLSNEVKSLIPYG